MSQPSDVPNVSMANTKKELLEAYEAAKERLQCQEKDLLDAEKARKRLEKQVAAATADSQAAQDPIKRLHDLRGAIGRELTDLAERFEAEIDAYRKVQVAVADKQSELQNLYEVETAASDLAALIDAQREQKERFKLETEKEKADFTDQINAMRGQWDREKAEHDRQAAEKAEAVKKQRQREKEEYEYAFAREKEQRKNALEDELRDLEKKIAHRRETFEAESQQRETELNARETAVAEQEKEIASLQKEVESFPKRLDTAVQAAVSDATERLARDFEKDKALMESRFEGEKNVLSGKIESLEKLVASQAGQITDLSKRHEQAYEKVQDIANRAVAAAKREVYSIPVRTASHASGSDESQNG